MIIVSNGDDDLDNLLFAVERDNHDDDDDDTCDGTMMMMMMTVHRLFAIESARRNLYKDLNHLKENLRRWLGLKD